MKPRLRSIATGPNLWLEIRSRPASVVPVPKSPALTLKDMNGKDVSRDGKICQQHTGFMPKERFEREIKAIL